nr:MAG TPA: hypothetical protein [Caudoviricetes sp.]
MSALESFLYCLLYSFKILILYIFHSLLVAFKIIEYFKFTLFHIFHRPFQRGIFVIILYLNLGVKGLC